MGHLTDYMSITDGFYINSVADLSRKNRLHIPILSLLLSIQHITCQNVKVLGKKSDNYREFISTTPFFRKRGNRMRSNGKGRRREGVRRRGESVTSRHVTCERKFSV